MSDLVGNPEDRFSHDEAHIIFNSGLITLADLRTNFSAIDCTCFVVSVRTGFLYLLVLRV